MQYSSLGRTYVVYALSRFDRFPLVKHLRVTQEACLAFLTILLMWEEKLRVASTVMPRSTILVTMGMGLLRMVNE